MNPADRFGDHGSLLCGETGSRFGQWLRPGSAAILAVGLGAVTGSAFGQARQPAGKTASTAASPVVELRRIDPPAGPGSRFPALAVEGPTTVIKEHQILMTWLEPGPSGMRLRFARLTGQVWSEPVTIAEPVSIPGPKDQPALGVIDTQAVRRTLVARNGDVVARSGDGGRTWTRLPAPALPFASFAGGDEGGYVFWLSADGEDSAKLLGSRILAGETLVDPSVVGGSGTAAAMTWDGPVVVYRDRNAEGGQSIAAVRRRDAQWTPPRTIHTEGRRPARTPESGPRVAALRREVAVAWYTDAGDRPRVLAAFSSDAGRTFGAPVEVDAKQDQTPSAPVDVALDDAGHAWVAWIAKNGRGEAALSLARVSPDGNRSQAVTLARERASHMDDVAQIAAAGDQVAVSWMERDTGSLRVATLPLAAIPAPDRSDTAAASSEKPKVGEGRGSGGEMIPRLEIESLGGDKVSVASLGSRAVLLNLWATWCLPCLKEMPELAALHRKYGTEGLAVVGVSVDDRDSADRVRQFVSDREIPFAVWLDPEMRLYEALRVRGLPATFIVDREGQIVLRRDGAIEADDAEIVGALRSVLKD